MEQQPDSTRTFLGDDFLTIKPPDREGIPDEARPRITLVNAKGDKCVVAKWACIEDARFDEVYEALMRLETFTKHFKPASSGPHEFLI